VLPIVGVAPPGFVGGELQNRYDLFVPISESNALAGIPSESANYVYLQILGRLQPGLARTVASARLAGVSRAMEDSMPKDRANAGAVYELLDASRGFDSWRSELHDPLMILMGAVSLVLLVACANLANLLLARAAERRQEFAIKLAIGISRWRLMRQLLVETAILAAAGGALALAAGAALTRMLLAIFNNGSDWSMLRVTPHAPVLWFTFNACLLTILLAGLYPAWKASRIDPAPGLQATSLTGRHGWMRRTLILVQVALAVVLLFGASLFSHSLRNLKTIDLGYNIDNVLSVQIGVKGTLRGNEGTAAPPEMAEILDRARHLPGVESAAFSSPGMLSGGILRSRITLADGPSINSVTFILASPNFFSTMRLRILGGRDFSKTDGLGAAPVAMVNRRLADMAWPGQSPIGKHFDGWNSQQIEVIGVIADSRDHTVREHADPTVYLAFDQHKTMGAALEMRCQGSMAAVESAVRQIVKSTAPNYEIARISSMELMRDSQISQERLLAFLSTLFGALGATLALVGIYGLIAYSVMRRTREIGIRISVGARPRRAVALPARGCCAAGGGPGRGIAAGDSAGPLRQQVAVPGADARSGECRGDGGAGGGGRSGGIADSGTESGARRPTDSAEEGLGALLRLQRGGRLPQGILQAFLRQTADDRLDQPRQTGRNVARERDGLAFDPRAAVALLEAPVGVKLP
jgi:predicted permease